MFSLDLYFLVDSYSSWHTKDVIPLSWAYIVSVDKSAIIHFSFLYLLLGSFSNMLGHFLTVFLFFVVLFIVFIVVYSCIRSYNKSKFKQVAVRNSAMSQLGSSLLAALMQFIVLCQLGLDNWLFSIKKWYCVMEFVFWVLFVLCLDLLRYDWLIVYILKSTPRWFDMLKHCKMITTIVIGNNLYYITLLPLLFLVMRTFKIWFLRNFQVYNMLLLTIITMFYIISSELNS